MFINKKTISKFLISYITGLPDICIYLYLDEFVIRPSGKSLLKFVFFWIGFNCRMFHILEKAQSFLEHTHFWKAFMGFIGKTCEVARYVNKHEGIQSSSLGKSVLSTPAMWVFSAFTVAAPLPQRRAILPRGGGWQQGLASAGTLSFTLSVITRLTTGPSAVTASPRNWPTLAHKF